LPTPENRIVSGAMPAARAARYSPIETMSAPSPSRARVASTAGVGIGLDRISDQRIVESASASRITRAWRTRVAEE
jgi:hypothetical protein